MTLPVGAFPLPPDLSVLPAVGDVRAGVRVGIDPLVGTLVLPLPSQVLAGVGYGAAGSELTGELPQRAPARNAGFVRTATLIASTRRPPPLSGGKRGAPLPYLDDIWITPLDPVDPETRQRLALQTPHELLQTFADGGLDIVEGDVLVVDGAEYPVRSAAEWLWRNSQYVHLIIEELKR